MRNRMIAATILACSSLAVATSPVLADQHSGQKKVMVCKDVKKSNTTGTVVGAAGGAVVGNVVAGHGNKTAGTLIGAGVGAVAGHEIAKNQNAKKPNQECHYEYR
jgi:hypothetical protein